MPPLLSQEDIDSRLNHLEGWRQEGRTLVRDFTFPSFKDAIAFVNRVVAAAEEIDHHPDITINYTRVTLSITTHSAGGITRRDFRLSERVDALQAQS